jgi:leucyl-tRNA synthetase
MHAELAARFIEVSTLLLTPFCPHTCEHIWSKLLGRSGTVTKAGFPVGQPSDKVLTAANKYLDEQVSSIRKGIAKVGPCIRVFCCTQHISATSQM